MRQLIQVILVHSVASRMVYQGRWWETLELNHPILKWVSRQAGSIARYRSELTLELSTVVRPSTGRFP